MLRDARVLVTGASRGIGAAIARTLAAAGARTLLVARGERTLQAVASSLPGASAFGADLSRAAAIAALVEAAPGLLGGPVDILINNAGIFAVAPVPDTDDVTIDTMLGLNLAAPFRLLRAFLPSMRAAGRGHVVTIGSVADRVAFAENGLYAATKFGGRALHEVVRQELRGSGVRATLISPGPTDTPLWDPIGPDERPGFTPRAAMLAPEAVADAVLWAVTRGATVNIDELRLSHA
jgi:NADP-dependent 3-hydroxy acid dehydrogenase YdfG